jgi:hypothetical protein
VSSLRLRLYFSCLNPYKKSSCILQWVRSNKSVLHCALFAGLRILFGLARESVSRERALCITNRLGAGKFGQRCSIPDRERDISFLPQMSTPTLGPIQHHLNL